ncbi:MAG: hypothetical protein E6J32_10800 [Chloroflexi bacterium]|nr:MAG: hypothetical protein E6J32_10800 [Chloroflexota bacterium]
MPAALGIWGPTVLDPMITPRRRLPKLPGVCRPPLDGSAARANAESMSSSALNPQARAAAKLR